MIYIILIVYNTVLTVILMSAFLHVSTFFSMLRFRFIIFLIIFIKFCGSKYSGVHSDENGYTEAFEELFPHIFSVEHFETSCLEHYSGKSKLLSPLVILFYGDNCEKVSSLV